MRGRLWITRMPGWAVLWVLWALVPPHLIAWGLSFRLLPADMPDAVEIYAVAGWLLTQMIALEVLVELVARTWPRRGGELAVVDRRRRVPLDRVGELAQDGDDILGA